MPRNVSDEEYAFLQARRQVADFVESIYNDPQLNTEAKALIKKKYPQMQIPDFDIEQKIERRLNEERDARASEERARKEEVEKQKFEETRSATQKKYSLTDEGMQDLEKFMLENNVGSYEVAARYKVATAPRVSTPTFDSSRFHFEKAPNFAEIAKDPEAWGRNEIEQALFAQEERAKQQRF